MSRYTRLIFKEANPYDAFSKLATRNGLSLVDEIHHDDHSPTAYREILANLGNTAQVEFIRDGQAFVCYLQISGPKTQPYVDVFRAAFGFLSNEEILTGWDEAETSEDKADAILKVGIAAYDQPPEDYMSRIVQALADKDDGVRDCGVAAFSYAPCEQFRARLIAVRDEDPSPDVRARAARLLSAWPAQGG